MPGRVVLRLASDVLAGLPDARVAGRVALQRQRLPEALAAPFELLLRERVLRALVPVFAPGGRRVAAAGPAALAAACASSWRAAEPGLGGVLLLEIDPQAGPVELARHLATLPGIEYAHAVPRRWACARAARPAADPHGNRQWGLRAVRWFGTPLPDASGIKLGVIDTGLDTSHPDLEFERYTHGPYSPTDVVGHGTHVCGIIAARVNPRLGTSGLCRCALSVWKVFEDRADDEGAHYVDELLYQRALNDAHRERLQVLNLSLGSDTLTRTEQLLVQRLLAGDCVVVAAVGNEFEDGNPREYPAAYPGVLAVGAIDEVGRRAPFSGTGPHLALVAPGVHVLSTLPLKPSHWRGPTETGYGTRDGTSMAAPHVAAAAALVRARFPRLSAEEVVARLTRRAARLPGMRGRHTREYGWGLLDVRAALS